MKTTRCAGAQTPRPGRANLSAGRRGATRGSLIHGTSMTTRTPSIQPDDGSALTPDITSAALAPEPGPTGEEPNVGTLARLLGEHAVARHVALVGLFVLALFYTLHLAQALILPIVLAI